MNGVFSVENRRQVWAAVLSLAFCCALPSCHQPSGTEDGASGQALLDAVKAGDNGKIELLLTEGAYTEVRDQRGDTPFLYAVRTGNVPVVRMMLAHEVDREARSGSGKGALELALDSGNEAMARCLLKGGISPDEIGHDNNPLLLKAVRFREMDTVRLLLSSGVTPSAAGKDGSTALHLAAGDGWMEGVDVLLAAGADPDAKDDGGGTPLWAAVNAADPTRRWNGIRKMLQAGADANLPGPEGKNLLVETSSRGLAREAVELVNYGAEVNAADGSGRTAVEVAGLAGDYALVGSLLSRGADGSSLLPVALERNDLRLAHVLFSHGVSPALRHEPQPSAKDGMVAFCVRRGLLDMARLCLQAGADSQQKGKEGQSPLHMAVAMRDADMVRILLDGGANPNKYFARPVAKAFLDLTKKESMRWFLRKERRVTPLMMASNNGDLDIISSLLEHGARKNVYSGRYRLYPLNFASRRSDIKAMQLILGQDPGEEKMHAVLDLSEQRVRLYNAKGKVIFSSRVSTGKSGYRTPKGVYVITDKHRSHSSTIYGSSMPYFQRLSCGSFGFHAGNCPGYPASHGCIRMPYRSAKRLFGITPVGTRVVIQR